MAKQSNGVVLFETAWLVAIATGIRRPSVNVKTGPMVQIWFLNKQLHPVVAQQLGKDKVVCGNCPMRPANGGNCYVQTNRAPAAIWRAYQAGHYPQANGDELNGKLVRFGAYGDPTKLPLAMVAQLAAQSTGWTGYTHQWRDPLKQGYKAYLMASVDSVDEQIEATKMGWRTFRVADKGNNWRLRDEVVCPASKEAGMKTTCAKCRLCAGTAKRGAKSVVIQKH